MDESQSLKRNADEVEVKLESSTQREIVGPSTPSPTLGSAAFNPDNDENTIQSSVQSKSSSSRKN